MPINDTYTVPEPVLCFLCDGERSFLALRLVHGLLYAMNTTLGGQMTLVPMRFGREHSVRTKTLGAAVGPVKEKDNRWMHKACEELVSQGIFDSLKITGRRLQFKLSRKFSDSFSVKAKAFAIMRTDQIRQCKTLHDLIFLSFACLHGNKGRPLFYLPRIPRHLVEPKAELTFMPQQPVVQDPWRVSWGRSSRAWVSAGVRVSGILGHSYLIAPVQDLVDDFVTQVAIKIQHPKTIWERGRLYKFSAGTRGVVEIPAGGTKSVLNAEALENKWHQTTIR